MSHIEDILKITAERNLIENLKNPSLMEIMQLSDNRGHT